MISITTNVLLYVTAACALALPRVPLLETRETGASAASQLLQVAPKSNTCDNSPFPIECATADQAAPYLISAMVTYGVTSLQEIAALISVIAFETKDFKYNTNHFPGLPGQGTRNMQMANFNFLYAKSIPTLATRLSAITTASSSVGLSDDQLNAIRALVLPDEFSWGSAAWFLTTQCAHIRPQIRTGGHEGYTAYLQCIGTDMTEERMAYWVRANNALGVS